MLIRRALSSMAPTIGLELHVQVDAVSKLFSPAPVTYTASTNSAVALMDAAVPGSLPVLNERCVEAAIQAALTFSSHLNMVSSFDRKHYFYADLPAGYQITQQRLPVATGGCVHFCTEAEDLSCDLVQIQIEQDSGKSLLDDSGGGRSLVDLNRSGVGLLEIVTKPQLRSAEAAACFVREVQQALRASGVSRAALEEGNLRVDANISVSREGEPLGTRTELKNLNSTRALRHGIAAEVARQIDILSRGGKVLGETRSYDSTTHQTMLSRDKESALDYRFLPEPNLPPLRLTEEEIEKCRASLPLGLYERRQVLLKEYELHRQVCAALAIRPALYDLFIQLVEVESCGVPPRVLVGYLLSHLSQWLRGQEYSPSITPPEHLSIVFILLYHGDISVKGLPHALNNLESLQSTSLEDLMAMLRREKLLLITDRLAVKNLCRRVLAGEKDLVKLYLDSSEKKAKKIFKQLVNAVESAGKNSVSPKVVILVLNELLDQFEQEL